MKITYNKNVGSTLKGLTIALGTAATGISVANATGNVAHADTVKAKENTDLKSIAKDNHVDLTDLAKANKLKEDDTVEKGDKIKLPTTYTVKKGDSVSEIANKLGLKTQDLLDKNNMTWQNATITIGQKLKLPNNKDDKQAQPDQKVQTTSNVQAPNSSSVVENAKQLASMNIPYVWGGESLQGFDCSGLVQYCERIAGVNVGRTTYAQVAQTNYKTVSQAQPGDLLFWGSRNAPYHVAIYIGNGQYVHAPAPGQNVTIGSFANYAPQFAGTLR